MQIILIPGLMNDGWIWRHQIAPLSRFAAVTIARNDGCDSLADMANRILAGTQGPLAVAGHSMGGGVALELVARAPERVARLALIATRTAGPGEGEAEARMRLVELARAEGMAAVARDWLPAMVAPGRRTDARLIDGLTRMLLRCDPETFAAQQKALLGRRDHGNLIGRIGCPTLSVAGTEDVGSSPALHGAIADAIPHGYLRVVEGAGHMIPVEAPDALTALLVEWLQR